MLNSTWVSSTLSDNVEHDSMKAARNLSWSGIVDSVKAKKPLHYLLFLTLPGEKIALLTNTALTRAFQTPPLVSLNKHLLEGFNSRFQQGGWYWPCVLTQSQGTVTFLSLPELRLPFVLMYNTVFLYKLSYYLYFSGHMFFVALFA